MEPRLRSLLEDRHSSVQSVGKFLIPNTNLAGIQFSISMSFHDIACIMLEENSEDSPELTAGLRKLLEAKDCFVRASLPF